MIDADERRPLAEALLWLAAVVVGGVLTVQAWYFFRS
jgi:hypothetical protein